uniref:RNase H type-1 domain-containing protein n=1 Tax=Lotus japonicus TaxID=34305 RepID=I3SDX5_LOTJA|nr:unknown [Lotus japonicus]
MEFFEETSTDLYWVIDLQKSRMAWWIKANWTLCPYQMFQLIENLESIKCPRPLRKPRSLDWEPPIGNMLKFNVDGASRGNPRVIVGWLGC